MAELGNTLSRARRARGITLEDAERDTHVSRRYLQALETEDFSVFPAPVYARGFLRTYSRYLGLNPEELIRVFPNGSLTVDITPLPTVVRPPSQMINVNWVVAGLVTLFLLGAGLLLLGSGDNSAEVSDGGNTSAQTNASPSPSSQVQAPPVSGPTGPVQGKAIGPIRPGLFPDFVGADLASTLAVLRDNQMNYVIIEVANRTTPKGLVVSQSPSAGSRAGPESAVTLVVSTGPPQ
jgi:cytoskeletal protein RodZ